MMRGRGDRQRRGYCPSLNRRVRLPTSRPSRPCSPTFSHLPTYERPSALMTNGHQAFAVRGCVHRQNVGQRSPTLMGSVTAEGAGRPQPTIYTPRPGGPVQQPPVKGVVGGCPTTCSRLCLCRQKSTDYPLWFLGRIRN